MKYTHGDIPMKQIKDNLDIFSLYFNDTANTSEFPSAIKLGDVITVFKKIERSIEENYRPVSILPIFSKMFEKFLVDFANILSKKSTWFP